MTSTRTRRQRALGVALLVAGLTLVWAPTLAAPPAGAAEPNTFTANLVVVGTPPEGATVTVALECIGPAAFAAAAVTTGEIPIVSASDSQEVEAFGSCRFEITPSDDTPAGTTIEHDCVEVPDAECIPDTDVIFGAGGSATITATVTLPEVPTTTSTSTTSTSTSTSSTSTSTTSTSTSTTSTSTSTTSTTEAPTSTSTSSTSSSTSSTSTSSTTSSTSTTSTSTSTSTTSSTSTTAPPSTSTTSTTAPTSTSTSTSTSSPTTSTTVGGASGTVSDDTVVAGQEITVTGEGFEPDELVTVDFESQPVRIGEFRANPTGKISGGVRIPPEAVTGSHDVVLAGRKYVVRIPVTVIAPGNRGQQASLPKTGDSSTTGLTVAGTVLLASGATLLALTRPRNQ